MLYRPPQGGWKRHGNADPAGNGWATEKNKPTAQKIVPWLPSQALYTNHENGLGRRNTRRVKLADAPDIGFRKTPVPRNVFALLNFLAIPLKIIQDIPSVAEEEHDIGIVGRVVEAQGVSDLVQAGEIDYGVAKQGVCPGSISDLAS